MSFSAQFYTFSKKVNSTKIPTGSGSQYDIILKAGCSILTPTISLDIGISSSPASFNYCYISSFNRYYFVSDWYFNERLWTAKFTVDPMASFKTDIGSYTGYVLRSASQSDPNVIDMYYPALSKVTTTANSVVTDPGWDSDMNGGNYVIGIMGKNNGQNGGAVTYYKASASQMRTLCNYLLNTSNFGQIDDISEDLLKCIFNPLQYIVSCMWFPTLPTVINGDPYVGWWQISGSGLQPLTNNLQYNQTLSFTVPKHPKASTRGNYLNSAPFSRYHLYAAGFGVIPIDTSYLLGVSSLTVHVKIDYATGSGKLTIEGTSGTILEEHFAQIGVPIAVGQNLLNQQAVAGVSGGVMNAIGGMLSGNLAGMLGGGLATIGSAAELSQSVPSTVGGNGSCTFSNQWKLIGRFFDVADEDIVNRGRPLCKAVTINTLSGYVLCSDADPNIACTDTEQSQIVSYMNGGFYYE